MLIQVNNTQTSLWQYLRDNNYRVSPRSDAEIRVLLTNYTFTYDSGTQTETPGPNLWPVFIEAAEAAIVTWSNQEPIVQFPIVAETISTFIRFWQDFPFTTNDLDRVYLTSCPWQTVPLYVFIE